MDAEQCMPQELVTQPTLDIYDEPVSYQNNELFLWWCLVGSIFFHIVQVLWFIKNSLVNSSSIAVHIPDITKGDGNSLRDYEEKKISGNKTLQRGLKFGISKDAWRSTGELLSWGIVPVPVLNAKPVPLGSSLQQFPTTEPSTVISPRLKPSTVESVSCGGRHALLLTHNGDVYEAGELYSHKRNVMERREPYLVPLFSQLRALRNTRVCFVSCGRTFSVAGAQDGTIYTWGEGDQGQLGHGSKIQGEARPRKVVGLLGTRVRQVQCGASFALAITSTGALYSWGSGSHGQLGTGSLKSTSCPVRIPDFGSDANQRGIHVTAVACGPDFSLAIDSRENVMMWGRGDEGQCGFPEPRTRTRPALIHRLQRLGVVQAACGRRHVLVRTAGGLLYSWGTGPSGELGTGETFQPEPLLVHVPQESRPVKVVHVAVGDHHNIAVTAAGRVLAWGDNSHGELGVGDTEPVQRPRHVPRLWIHGRFEVSCGSAFSLLLSDLNVSSAETTRLQEEHVTETSPISPTLSGGRASTHVAASEPLLHAERMSDELIENRMESQQTDRDTDKKPYSGRQPTTEGLNHHRKQLVAKDLLDPRKQSTPNDRNLPGKEPPLEDLQHGGKQPTLKGLQHPGKLLTQEDLRHHGEHPPPQGIQHTGRKATPKDLQRAEKHRQDQHDALLKVWKRQILMQWQAKRNDKKTLEMWQKGVPNELRRYAWPLVVGNALKVTPNMYEMYLERVRRLGTQDSCSSGRQVESIGREDSLELIDGDLPRTFPAARLFTSDGPLYHSLRNVLGAYACYRPDLGYIQGMSYLAANICLQLQDEYLSFQCLANVLSKGHLFAFFMLDTLVIDRYYKAFMDAFREQTSLVRLEKHLWNIGVRPELYLFNWLQTLFLKVLPLEAATRVWDCFLLHGSTLAFKVALAILKLFSNRLMNSPFDDCIRLLSHSPGVEDIWTRSITEQKLFDTMETIEFGPRVVANVDALDSDVYFYKQKQGGTFVIASP